MLPQRSALCLSTPQEPVYTYFTYFFWVSCFSVLDARNALPCWSLPAGVPGQAMSVPSSAPAEPHPSCLLGSRILASRMRRCPNSRVNARISWILCRLSKSL